ncbi:MAG: dihydroorotase family protein [Candidatus Bathyarchaeota archaeon]|nr:dihydroorotase family protein [Candidatus Bathyarchaeota archaeon]MDH5732939.1 dihydroorotase family protein [Candidatus Bathyarchaeota archaeon]
MPVDLVLHNAKIYTTKGLATAHIAIDNGKIFKIAKTNLPKSSTKLNLKGNLVLPGLIDSHVHLRDQLLAYKEDFFSGTAAAAAGGVTSVMDMPNNNPITMDSKSLRERMSQAKNRIFVNVAFYSTFPKNTKKPPLVVKEGAIAFKLYLSKKIGDLNINDDESLSHAFEKAMEMNIPFAVHAEDRGMLEQGKEEMKRAGKDDIEAYIKVHSPNAEEKAISRVTRLARRSGAPIHFCHLSSLAGLQALSKARTTSLSITCEVTPHHLLLSSRDLKHHKTCALTDPPLRSRKDTETLWSALKLGSIDTIASDHAPHTIEEKKAESVWDAKPGIPGLETTLPLLLTQVNEKRLTIQELIRLTSEKPATIFHLRDRGHLEEGYRADLAVVDMKQEHKINPSQFFSKAKYSPFDGWKVKGKLLKTFVNGHLAYDDGEMVSKPGTGQIIRCVR